MKRPSFQFYPADWRKDAALQSCSISAQGLWVNAMCIAHECEPYGHLTVNNKPMTTAQVGRLVGLSVKDCERLIAELEGAGVLSRMADGGMFSRRMVRDEDLRNRRANGGIAGSEHGKKGAEYGKKGGRPSEVRGVIKPPLKPPPSSSSSTSVITVPKGTDGVAVNSPENQTKVELWKSGKSLLREQGMPDTQCGTFVGKLCRDYGDETVIEAVRAAVVKQPVDAASYLKSECQRLKGDAKTTPSKHSGFKNLDYRKGIADDGSFD